MDSELQQIVERIRGAAVDATPLRIRGVGTKDFHGVPAGAGVPVLDTRALAGITAYEPSELVVTVRAGTPLAELEAALAAEGQCLPFEPPHFGADGAGGTVGGMVAAGWSGPARASVGAVRDYVLGVQLVDGRGEVLSFGGQVMKNVAGYDVSRVLAGSFGTLGVIAEVSLKVLPVAPAEATLRFECTQAEAIDLLNGWGGRPLPLNASCWVEDTGRGTLYLRLRGAVAAVEAARAHLGGEPQPDAAGDWTLCRDQRLPWFAERGDARDLWRLSVPQTAPVIAPPAGAGEDAGPLIEWHGGQRWYRARP
ncbi:MAG TPA: glycolate oxidase subunit GlcE, partial [Variovorax sp.]|nr:glycolate oxidase subunit GlcE [Variovorax sp.]